MKDLTPNGIALRISFLVAVVVTLLVFVLEELNASPSIVILAIFPASFIASYVAFRIAVERFIYKKIKVIYRTIHNLKLKKVDSSKEFNLTQIQTEVEDWDKLNKEEIDRLKGLENYRREFVGNLSHELKTPIFNIQGYLLTLLEGGLEDPNINVNYLEKASKSVERMISLIEDLDDISKLESGVIEMDIEKVDLVKLITEVISSLELKANNNNISISFLEMPSKPIWVNIDANGINQVLVNLIVNSIKYGKENGETLIRFFDMHENILVEVADNGRGIAAEHLPRLFERFYRIDKSRARESGGTGLGLSIVKHIIEAHSQTINVRSTVDVGSTFSFTLKKA
ncbi:MAG: sensor histidine kinase [Flavobacteriales bacterium]|nr:sensor histidine kinase [Flavobacteriales bacterium]NQX96277.1 sensor histidine kinase [Flavobacteriales bacterium]